MDLLKRTNSTKIRGQGNLWVVRAPALAGANKAKLEHCHLNCCRVSCKPIGETSYFFMENRNFQKMGTKRGKHRLIALYDGSDWCLGVCLTTNLTSCSYLKWNGNLRSLSNLVSTLNKQPVREPLGNTLTWESVYDSLTLQTIDFTLNLSSTLFWVNLVSSPNYGAITADDGCFEGAVTGPDCVLDGAIPRSLCDSAESRVPLHRFLQSPRLDLCQKTGDFVVITGPANIRKPKHEIRKHERLFDLPFIGAAHRETDVLEFGRLDKSSVSKLIRLTHGHSVVEFNKALRELSTRTEKLFVVDARNTRSSKKPLFLVSNVSDVISSKNKLTRHENTNMIALLSPEYTGHVVAAWYHTPKEVSTVDKDIYTAYIEAFGKNGSFPTRKCCDTFGHQSYLGMKCSSSTCASPVQSSSSLPFAQYTRQTNKNFHAHPTLHQHSSILTDVARSIGQRLHYHQLKLVESSAEPSIAALLVDTVCTNKIVTGGGFDNILMFAASSHVDGDKLPQVFQDCYTEELTEQRRYHCYKEKKDCAEAPPPVPYLNLPKPVCVYLESWNARFGFFDAPTTCAYGEVGCQPPGSELYQYFVHHGLSLAVRYGPGSVNSFFGCQSEHGTAISIMVIAGMVYFHDPAYCTFAWGASKAPDSVTAMTVKRRRREDDDSKSVGKKRPCTIQ